MALDQYDEPCLRRIVMGFDFFFPVIFYACFPTATFFNFSVLFILHFVDISACLWVSCDIRRLVFSLHSSFAFGSSRLGYLQRLEDRGWCSHGLMYVKTSLPRYHQLEQGLIRNQLSHCRCLHRPFCPSLYLARKGQDPSCNYLFGVSCIVGLDRSCCLVVDPVA